VVIRRSVTRVVHPTHGRAPRPSPCPTPPGRTRGDSGQDRNIEPPDRYALPSSRRRHQGLGRRTRWPGAPRRGVR
jgi:hypothetical protein